MNGKKLLAFFLAFVMMFATMSFPALADDGETSDYVAQIGETKYESLDKAIEAANDTGDTITLLDHVTFNNPETEDPYVPYKSMINFTIDLNKKTLTLPDTYYHFNEVEFKNGEIVLTHNDVQTSGGVFYMVDDSTITFDHVTLTTSEDFKELAVYGGQSIGKSKVIVKDSDFTVYTQSGSDKYKLVFNQVDVSMEKSTLTHIDQLTEEEVAAGKKSEAKTFCNGKIELEKSDITAENVRCLIDVRSEAQIVTIDDETKITVELNENTDRDWIFGATGGDGVADAVKKQLKDSENLNVSVKGATVAVAKIGDDEYETLAEAIESLNGTTGDVTIELLADCDYAYGARVDWNHEGTVTINGNGKVLNLKGTDTDWSSIANNGGKIVFNDMTINKTEEGNGAWNNHAINFKSEVEMNDVVVNNSVTVDSDATFTKVKFNEDGEYYCLYIEAEESNVVVDNCTFTATNNGRGIKIIDQYTATGKVNLTVKDSTFETASKAAILVTSTKGAKITAYGNDITNVAADSEHLVWVDEDRAKYASEVKVVDLSGNEIKGAVKVEGAEAVAKIGEVEYDSLAKAIANANDGDTVTLLANASGDGIVIEEGKFATDGITINLGGFTYTVSENLVGSPNTMTSGFQFLKGNNITIENGTLTTSEDVQRINCTYPGKGAWTLIMNYANLKLDKVTLDGTTLAEHPTRKDMPITLSNNNGDVVITNGSVIKKSKKTPAGYAMDVYNSYSNSATGYKDVTVTVSADSTITGTVNIGGNTEGNVHATLKIDENSYTDNGDYKKVDDKFVKREYVATAVSGGKELNFTTLKSAISYVDDGETINVISDITLKLSDLESQGTYGEKDYYYYGYVGGKTITLNLNGHKIDLDESAQNYDLSKRAIYRLIYITGGANVTVTGDGTIDSDPTTNVDNYIFALADTEGKQNTITFENGTYYGECVLKNYSHGNRVYVKGGLYGLAAKKKAEAPENAIGVFNTQNTGNVAIWFTGGTLIGSDPRNMDDGNMVADGYVVTRNGDQYTVIPKENIVATITDAKGRVYSYTTLEDAVAAAIDGETVTLLANASGDGIVFAENKFATNGITIDLNGNTYTISGKAVGSPGSETNGFQLLKDNKITIKNGTITSTETVINKGSIVRPVSILIQNYSDLTLDGVELDGSKLLNVNWTPYTLSDCNGNIVITNSTITAKEGGFAFDVDNKPGYNGVTVTIDKDSVVNGLVQIARNNRADSTTVATLVIGENSYNVNGVYAKNGDKFDMYVAQIGKTYYATLEDAVAKANDGDTVTLLANASGNGVEIVNEKFKEDGLVIDLGGYTYTIVDETVGSEGTKTAGFHFGSDNNITIKNGKVYSEVAKHLVQNYANLTLDGVIMDGSKLNYDKTQDTYTVSHSNGTLTLKSGTTVIGGANGYAFDVSEFGSYKGAKAVVESDAIVKGKVEVKNWKNETFTGVLVDANKKEYTTEGVYTQQEDGTFKLFEESETPEVPEFFNKMLIGRKAATKENFDGTKYYPVKFYAAIDDPTKYKEVGFTITATKKDGTTVTRTLSTTTVYKQITISSEENTEVIKAEILGGTYMYGGELLFTSTEWDNASVNLTIIPYAVTNEGVTLTGKTQNVAEPFKE